MRTGVVSVYIWQHCSIVLSGGYRNFPGAPTPKVSVVTLLFCNFFVENYMKMKKFGPPRGGGVCVPAAPLDRPMILTHGVVMMYRWQHSRTVRGVNEHGRVAEVGSENPPH